METSELLKERERRIVPEALKLVIDALDEKDWEGLAPVIMSESDSLHEACADTTPPIEYMNHTT